MEFPRMCALGVVAFVFSIQTTLDGQKGPPSVGAHPDLASVPLIGCESDGQAGPVAAPEGGSRFVAISAEAARELAYYRSAQGIVGVLAPRGWHCYGTYGSSGDNLFVGPEPIDTKDIFSTGPGWRAGPAIQLSYSCGDTSGRFAVAKTVARVFPAYKAFAAGVMSDFEQWHGPLVFGPYPGDALVYKSKSVVEYTTAARQEGLGTQSWIPRNGGPISGVAILFGDPPNLLLLSARLPPKLNPLTPVIVGELEREAAHLPGE